MVKASAFILIGGKSARFGSPKWQVNINGKSVLDIVWDACNYFENRIVVGKEKPDGFDKPFIQDTLKINAPMNGLYTALSNTITDWNLLLSCDLPLVDFQIINLLGRHLDKEVDAIVPIANGKTQVTCGYYNKRILPFVENEIQKDNYSLFKLVQIINSVNLDFGEDLRFWNMNTKDDMTDIFNYLSDKK
ncbi:MAG: molybdenum cofactor guanylyltransferase [Candidatus Marinimicrobia bacterium]|jgi:molybdopterin-guanine dinucleotide biosynthesis protein A|nr:molybdenum cofactor guanylyltransferase [Candidatus Neomarinimicrobiota bacterium]